MCGIIGCTGSFDTAKVLLRGLSKLEYRGYDSAGIAVLCENEIKVIKCKGRLLNLAALVEEKNPGNCSVGIGHTRWATHGEPNDINSHPHVSGKGKFCVVHNGIIENYMDIRENLRSAGYSFVSETDSEVIAHLLEYNYKGDTVSCLRETVMQLEGSYALGVLDRDEPKKIFTARKDSPLILGLTDKGGIIASDIPAMLEYTRDIFIAEDGEIASVSDDAIIFYNQLGLEIDKKTTHVDWEAGSAEKGGFEHFMLKEIHEEPTAIRDTIANDAFDRMNIVKPDRMHIIACGTAYHAGVVGKYVIEEMAGIPVEVEVASEYRYKNPIVGKNHLTVVISQSGETIDTLFAMRKAKEMGSRVIAVVNVVGSSIAREADDVFYTRAGPEIAVASTKAYSTQLTAMYMLASKLSEGKLKLDGLRRIPDMIKGILSCKEDIQRFASDLFGGSSIFFIGRGLDYALSMEGSLKLKEISYIHSEAYAGGELKHGTIALIEEGTPVICSMTQPHIFSKMAGNVREIQARGAKVLSITSKSMENEAKRVSDMVISLPDIEPVYMPITAIVPMQLFAYYCAVLKGCDVDKPRNLAKSVTVE
ncbi:MAG: glutamine--fructose-6-phosphate transaminase (isomerizing) [Clostridia bacterium]|nr:glutamine--fructose-6-phosphate transaminase (isomerizing) [Clostridia bacterium]MBN2882795.1 glutamine--fructose-6-phosphate transaminase (isomerizing) [Clostridia bacterium]